MARKTTTVTPAIVIDFPDDCARMPIANSLCAFGYLNVPLGNNTLNATLSWDGSSQGGSKLASLPPTGGRRPFDWGFSFALSGPALPAQRFELLVQLIDPSGAVVQTGRCAFKSSRKKPTAAKKQVALPIGPPGISYPGTNTPNLPRSLLAFGTISPAPASISATIYNTSTGEFVVGVQQSPPPGRADWGFQFTIPTTWANTASCTLVVTATDSDGYITTVTSTGLTFQ
jgi:hypothetical protein